jgi:hypothetical protein
MADSFDAVAIPEEVWIRFKMGSHLLKIWTADKN